MKRILISVETNVFSVIKLLLITGRLSKSLFRSICHGLASKAVPCRMKTAAFGSEDSIGQKPTSRGSVIRCAKSSRVREVLYTVTDSNWTSNPITRGGDRCAED